MDFCLAESQNIIITRLSIHVLLSQPSLRNPSQDFCATKELYIMANLPDAKALLNSRGLYDGPTIYFMNPLLLVEKIIRCINLTSQSQWYIVANTYNVSHDTGSRL